MLQSIASCASPTQSPAASDELVMREKVVHNLDLALNPVPQVLLHLEYELQSPH